MQSGVAYGGWISLCFLVGLLLATDDLRSLYHLVAISLLGMSESVNPPRPAKMMLGVTHAVFFWEREI
ncbi:MAG: hypothetical protein ICV63_22050 [Coleofasciculus sp. Co-bin14]|nr:hypothetical protein [Coleofasciculus sp. Co-bin14]